MDEIDITAGISSPSKSMSYMYRETDFYLDSSNASTISSPIDSPYDLSFPGVYPSPEHTDGLGETTQPESQPSVSKPVTKRKRENRYKNAPPSVLSRRRAQNRASQRAYRERKDQRIKDLEVLLNEAQKKNDILSQAYSSLQAEYIKLKREQETTHRYQQPDLAYDPTIGSALGDIDLFIYGGPSSYTM
ncbi:uncharacterized protein GGS25DRAFT_371690 [Hypoxylon fragiforme]|uniref:uncharacterized protein n=1 Tax=Hypoxylon fragiforme TaxID=63214 RepID=UPI0020C6A0EB|nr:uncharacterized protein GGS25DRAFT_371690 [Hypoxylon fragiforme]KAI2606059.1 hypothetical protein GGS25DRAFT_371690 [Hypoxylon fragiforme]